MKKLAKLLALVIGVAASVGVARADDIATEVTPQPAAPITMTRCVLADAFWGWQASLNVYNRASHAMIDASVEYRFFDRDNTQIGQTAYTYTLSETLSPDDTASLNGQSVGATLSEPKVAVSRITCKLTAAHFTGRIAWRTGATWLGGPLHPAPRHSKHGSDDAVSGSGATAPMSATRDSVPATTRVAFDVTNAWNDRASDGLFVHDTLLLRGGDHDATVRATDFVLHLTLANGAKKSYPAMHTQAPTFNRYDVLSKTTKTVPQVDPQTDLGKLGSIIVPAHSSVAVTLTFPVPDQVADASANRDVALH